MQNNIIESVYNKLIDTIGYQIDNQIYDTISPDNTVLPVITFNIVSDNIKEIMSSSNSHYLDIDIQINIFDYINNGVKNIRGLNDELFALHNASIDINGYQNCIISCKNRGSLEATEDVVNIISEYNIKGCTI